MSEPTDQKPLEIDERHESLPWWGWALIALALIYAFLIGPFNWFFPQG